MPEHVVVQRWRHPAILIFLLGGLLGALINMGVTLLLVQSAGWNPMAAFFAGTFINQAFH